jgi:hypothetical protein
MCSVQGGVQLIKDVAGLIVSPVTAVVSSRSILLDESDEDSDTDDETSTEIPMANTTFPQYLNFEAPADAVAGKPVCIQGPHGPVRIPLPEDVEAGKQCTIRLGPPEQSITVPEGAEAGALLDFNGPQGEKFQLRLPEGYTAGDEIKATPPVLLIQVPKSAKTGDQVRFMAPHGHQCSCLVPLDVSTGQYFPVMIDTAMLQHQADPLTVFLPMSVDGVTVLIQEKTNTWRLTNAQLQSTGPGVAYRRSKQLDSVLGPNAFAQWDTVLEGVDTGEGWLQCQVRCVAPGHTGEIETSPTPNTMAAPRRDEQNAGEKPVEEGRISQLSEDNAKLRAELDAARAQVEQLKATVQKTA